MKYPIYNKYKDTSIKWLPQIPESWGVNRISYTTYVKGRIGWQGLRSEEFIDEGPFLVTGTDFNSGAINWNTCHHVAEERYWEDPYIQLKEDDLLITKDGTIGKVAIAKKLPDKATLNSGIFVTRPLKPIYSTRYMYWILNSDVFTSFIDFTKSGTTILHLYQHVFLKFLFPLPTKQEQKSIADFLDRETTRIDALIEKKQKLIELLKEKRTALITRAVTKGMAPNVKMKDSGIDWLGEVPEHWKVKKFKYISKKIQTGITPPTNNEEYFEGDFNWYTPADFSDTLRLKNSKRKISYLAIEEGDAKVFPKNSVLLVGIGATLGKVGYSEGLSSANQQVNALHFDTLTDAKFYSYYIHANRTNIVSFSNAATLAILNQSQTKDIHAPFLKNQKEKADIVEFIERNENLIFNLIGHIEQAITKHQEYRTALISAAVTGKIKVTDIDQ